MYVLSLQSFYSVTEKNEYLHTQNDQQYEYVCAQKLKVICTVGTGQKDRTWQGFEESLRLKGQGKTLQEGCVTRAIGVFTMSKPVSLVSVSVCVGKLQVQNFNSSLRLRCFQ